jgi:hypothetical protein
MPVIKYDLVAELKKVAAGKKPRVPVEELAAFAVAALGGPSVPIPMPYRMPTRRRKPRGPRCDWPTFIERLVALEDPRGPKV